MDAVLGTDLDQIFRIGRCEPYEPIRFWAIPAGKGVHIFGAMITKFGMVIRLEEMKFLWGRL